jgi:asparagine synthase (glutamine-hydrolysing)
MSVQFGKVNLDGKPVDPRVLDRVRPLLTPYGPDGEGSLCRDNIEILYRAFQTTKESQNQLQPHIAKSGAVITWDGRLDNRKELIDLFEGELSTESTDLSIVAAAYEHLGADSFRRLIGDWAFSVWDPGTRSLILAKDFVGTRHLYYSIGDDQVTWSTILDPLVLLAGRSLALEEEYIAGWLSYFPAPHLTPYMGIHSVPPSCFVQLGQATRKIRRYWDFEPAKNIRYGSEGEYEEHFRTIFGESVRRRLRSHAPVLAELSGGMDSSSIVCVADDIMARGSGQSPRLDTVSYYDDSEPHWNERAYFAAVETRRGREGCHIPIDSQRELTFDADDGRFAPTPSAYFSAVADATFTNHVWSQGARVLLSGMGGDEVTGGVPTPIPELANLLAQGRIGALARQLRLWALEKRRPWPHLFFETVCAFLPGWTFKTPEHKRPAPWLEPRFITRNRAAVSGYEGRLTLFGPPPSFQENVNTLNTLRRQLACSVTPSEPLLESRFPYLDRDLLEFLYAIPREQLLRPGCRRALVRHALLGIVPGPILERRRKAFVSRGPLVALASHRAGSDGMARNSIGETLGVFDSQRLAEALRQARRGAEVPLVTLIRTLQLECWLRHVARHGVVNRLSALAATSSSSNTKSSLVKAPT